MGLLYEMVTNKREATVLLHEENRTAGDNMKSIQLTPQGRVLPDLIREDKNET
ncbi:hypothetical protein [Paenibacillus harenae]|uniref:hypothetical protein n=1 Tax=Paenibacillus harenae TaxID=306543 RepID=UPI00278F4744|nr:hypothetical protein [Paenibacillus harenae]MDQ0062418.1 hypothetical protein [Paenibacillus harenae]